MKWRRGHSSRNVQLRRGGSGGGGILSLILMLSRFGWKGIALGLVLGGGLYVCGGSNVLAPLGLQSSNQSDVDKEMVSFVSYVLDSAQDSFSDEVSGYRDAQLVIFQGRTQTRCGVGAASVGPFYCPSGETIYIDLAFYRELKDRFGAPGDFAQAYVIAHEVGHHLQHQLGDLRATRDKGPLSASVQTELQADCYAGVWAKKVQAEGLLEEGDIDEALGAAEAIGDDAIQTQSRGRVRPESWTHGSSAQRKEAFLRGLRGGKLEVCR